MPGMDLLDQVRAYRNEEALMAHTVTPSVVGADIGPDLSGIAIVEAGLREIVEGATDAELLAAYARADGSEEGPANLIADEIKRRGLRLPEVTKS